MTAQVTINVTHAAYDALGLDNTEILESRALAQAISVTHRKRSSAYVLPMEAARDLVQALASSHMIEAEQIGSFGIGAVRSVRALLAQASRAVDEAEDAAIEAADAAAPAEAAEAAPAPAVTEQEMTAIEAKLVHSRRMAVRRLALMTCHALAPSSAYPADHAMWIVNDVMRLIEDDHCPESFRPRLALRARTLLLAEGTNQWVEASTARRRLQATLRDLADELPAF